ncbi:MAG: cation transporter [Defluviitaleaceae bacterium]|nr:cation transporter [Defluviitaleaceae bacterium]
MTKVELKVAGMTCKHCELAVVNVLKDLGAENVSANKDNGQVVVEYDADVVSVEDMKKEIAEAGYAVM